VSSTKWPINFAKIHSIGENFGVMPLGWGGLDDLIFSHIFGPYLNKALPIREGDISFESQKCPLQSGHFKFYKLQALKKLHAFEWNKPEFVCWRKNRLFYKLF
jgi:hypothetical protein